MKTGENTFFAALNCFHFAPMHTFWLFLWAQVQTLLMIAMPSGFFRFHYFLFCWWFSTSHVFYFGFKKLIPWNDVISWFCFSASLCLAEFKNTRTRTLLQLFFQPYYYLIIIWWNHVFFPPFFSPALSGSKPLEVHTLNYLVTQLLFLSPPSLPLSTVQCFFLVETVSCQKMNVIIHFFRPLFLL